MTSLKRNFNRRNRPCQVEPQLLQILQWNAGGMSQEKKIQIQKILDAYNVDIFTIMESNLTDDKLTYYQFTGYTLHLQPKYRQVNRSTPGKEIEGILNSSPLELIYSDEDPATYLHYNGTTTTPDLLLVSSNISEVTQRKIINDSGSGHNPVIVSITINSKSVTPKMPTKVLWKFMKADWPKFTNLLETELNTSPINYNQHPDKLCNNVTNIIIKCTKKTIPHGKVEHSSVLV
nr:hypothetical protein HmN_000402600 [Hymenolepis microstoma]